ncbi:uncharacterized protein V1510DRAFT_403165 [Dipodascopsis tothii]|uniref:uncharacterized protein n=1 Tax=Dipodascopsis tothii TaxID=44089 RepID=UPI0034CFC5E7
MPAEKTEFRPGPISKQRLRGMQMIIFSVPLVALTSYILYKRVVLGEEQRVRLPAPESPTGAGGADRTDRE